MIPDKLTLADGASVPHKVGTRVFNYYDHKAGAIKRTATYPSPAAGGGEAWWVTVLHDDGTSALLDGSRMCSVETARAKGWLS